MRIEHFALNVAEPAAMAEWYAENLGFEIVRSGPAPVDMRFIADETGKVLMEIYHNDAASVLDYPSMHLLELHLALVSDDVHADADRLVKAGATFESTETTPVGDEMVIVRDPWGLALQLMKRKEPML